MITQGHGQTLHDIQTAWLVVGSQRADAAPGSNFQIEMLAGRPVLFAGVARFRPIDLKTGCAIESVSAAQATHADGFIAAKRQCRGALAIAPSVGWALRLPPMSH